MYYGQHKNLILCFRHSLALRLHVTILFQVIFYECMHYYYSFTPMLWGLTYNFFWFSTISISGVNWCSYTLQLILYFVSFYINLGKASRYPHPSALIYLWSDTIFYILPFIERAIKFKIWEINKIVGNIFYQPNHLLLSISLLFR